MLRLKSQNMDIFAWGGGDKEVPGSEWGLCSPFPNVTQDEGQRAVGPQCWALAQETACAAGNIH